MDTPWNRLANRQTTFGRGTESRGIGPAPLLGRYNRGFIDDAAGPAIASRLLGEHVRSYGRGYVCGGALPAQLQGQVRESARAQLQDPGDAGGLRAGQGRAAAGLQRPARSD